MKATFNSRILAEELIKIEPKLAIPQKGTWDLAHAMALMSLNALSYSPDFAHLKAPEVANLVVDIRVERARAALELAIKHAGDEPRPWACDACGAPGRKAMGPEGWCVEHQPESWPIEIPKAIDDLIRAASYLNVRHLGTDKLVPHWKE